MLNFIQKLAEYSQIALQNVKNRVNHRQLLLYPKSPWLSMWVIESCSNKTAQNVASSIRQFRDVRLSHVDADYIEGWLHHLRARHLKESSINTYFSVMKGILKKATAHGIIHSNPIDLLPKRVYPKRSSHAREHLLYYEVQKLMETSCRNENVKRAFLFACFVGLRYSDIRSLRYADIVRTSEGWCIVKLQKKSQRLVTIPLSSNALLFLNPTADCDRNQLVFSLPSLPTVCVQLKQWASKANIGKHITFHVSRHTFASLMLENGTDIYVVSRLLGHSSVNVTQIYSHLTDNRLKKAVDAIPPLH